MIDDGLTDFFLPARPDLGVPHRHRFVFYLGTHKPQHMRASPVPLFLSYSELSLRLQTDTKRKNAIRDLRPRSFWAMDSGGFTQLGKYGRWTVEPERYADDVRFLYHEIGGMQWAAIQDWMVEPIVLKGGLTDKGRKAWARGLRPSTGLKTYEHYFPGTHLDLDYHQQLTVSSYLELTRIAPEIPWAPVLQGWHTDDYFRCVELYERAGVDLYDAPAVGVGSICRRQQTSRAGLNLSLLANDEHGYGLTNLHGFGFKTDGLPFAAHFLASADSTAWSMDAKNAAKELATHRHGYGARGSAKRKQLEATLAAQIPVTTLPPLKGKKCNNCLSWALLWRERMLERIFDASRLPHEQIVQVLDRLNWTGGIQEIAEEIFGEWVDEAELCELVDQEADLPPPPDTWEGGGTQATMWNPPR